MEKLTVKWTKLKQLKREDIWVQDIKGIQYFIDANNNVYNHEEVLANTSQS